MLKIWVHQLVTEQMTTAAVSATATIAPPGPHAHHLSCSAAPGHRG
jgi:hypothetical protein